MGYGALCNLKSLKLSITSAPNPSILLLIKMLQKDAVISLNNQVQCDKKLMIVPGGFNYLGGTLMSLLSLVKGFYECDMSHNLCVVVLAESLTEKYLKEAGYGNCIQSIKAKNESQFLNYALNWVNKQPSDFPLLLDNWSDWYVMPKVILAAPSFRIKNRPIYHFCHDLIMSYNLMGELLRRIGFACFHPVAICNSEFTAQYIKRLMPKISGIIYQPVDKDIFNTSDTKQKAPQNLQVILSSGAKIILTPSRLNKPHIINDKNLRGLIPVVAHLKKMGENYHAVVIGPDESDDGSNTRDLLNSAVDEGVADCFTVLPPCLDIENYYKHADIIVTLAPREPFGRTVVEAIACGVPVIGSCTGGINEILQHFAPQWTVDPNNPKAVAEAIVRVMNDPTTPNLLAKGKAWVDAECSVANYAQKMMQLTGVI